MPLLMEERDYLIKILLTLSRLFIQTIIPSLHPNNMMWCEGKNNTSSYKPAAAGNTNKRLPRTMCEEA